ncbi:hypothetical protein BG015_005955, partial [Linnemannia schmuckeri]
MHLLDNTLEHLSTTLTSPRLVASGTYTVNLEWLLETLPLLKHPSLEGPLLLFDPPPSRPSSYSDTTSISSTAEIEQSDYRLESLTSTSKLLMQPRPASVDIFKRLPNLKTIRIMESLLRVSHPGEPRLGEFGRVLEQYCPNIDCIETTGALQIWFFRLLLLSPSIRTAMRKLKQELEEQLAQQQEYEYRVQSAQNRGCASSGATGATRAGGTCVAGACWSDWAVVFSQIEKVGDAGPCTVGAGFCLFGIQAQLLTHVALQDQTGYGVWNLYEIDPEVVEQRE